MSANLNDLTPDVESVVRYLRANGLVKQVDRVVNRGVPRACVLGTPKGFVMKAGKAIGTNQRLAEALWSSEIHEARLTAVLVADPDNNSTKTIQQWAGSLWSWDLADHLARYLLPHLDSAAALIDDCAADNRLYTRRLAFAGIACVVARQAQLSSQDLAHYLGLISQVVDDDRHHVRKAVVWSLVEIGKVDDACQHAAIEFAQQYEAEGRNAKWISRNAIKALALLVSVPERRRLLSQRSKTGKHR